MTQLTLASTRSSQCTSCQDTPVCNAGQDCAGTTAPVCWWLENSGSRKLAGTVLFQDAEALDSCKEAQRAKIFSGDFCVLSGCFHMHELWTAAGVVCSSAQQTRHLNSTNLLASGLDMKASLIVSSNLQRCALAAQKPKLLWYS